MIEGEERETSLNAARSGDSEEDSEGSPLLIRRGNDEDDDERRSPVLTSPRERTPVPVGGGAVQTGTFSRGAAILRRAPGFSFPDKVDFHYEGPAPLVYVPEKCGEFLCQLRGRAKPLPAVKDLIFGGEYEEAARAKLLGDSTMNVVIDEYDTALKGALDELELAKKEFAEKEEVSARQLKESRANLQKLNGMMTRTEGVPGRGARVDGDNVPVLVLSDTSVEGRDSPPPEESRRDGEENTGEVSEDAAVQVSPIARESSVKASELSALNDRESDREA
ncbi:hypothetical protein DY000_02006158 [Brassica cretica]|uniref:Uncharacterized protein n=1 Tax=Brassica cretica TaxID=69181 RepID=A0ABQ7CI43_BRACR|nr:hypothetical protein DY000_02006158 [Brassica cretica]